MCTIRKTFTWLALAIGIAACSAERTPPVPDAQSAVYRLEKITGGLEHPWGLTFVSANTMLVTERPGRLRIIRDGILQPDPVSGLPVPLARGQGGYLDVIADPDFQQTRRIYLSYAKGTKQNNGTAIIAVSLSDNLSEATHITPLFTTDFAKAGGAHYGSRFAFLPDGSIVFGLGDGFSYRNEAQNLQNHMGASIRIRPDGSVPSDNPFMGRPTLARPEIYTYGHRNMQGTAYDPDTGILYGLEHGPKGGDELNILRPGGNYGWPLASYGINYTGTAVSDKVHVAGTEAPILHWTPSIAASSVSVYSGAMYPQFKGDLLIASLKAGDIRRVRVREGAVVAQEVLIRTDQRLRHVAVSPYDGHIYVLSDNGDDALYRLVRQY